LFWWFLLLMLWWAFCCWTHRSFAVAVSALGIWWLFWRSLSNALKSSHLHLRHRLHPCRQAVNYTSSTPHHPCSKFLLVVLELSPPPWMRFGGLSCISSDDETYIFRSLGIVLLARRSSFNRRITRSSTLVQAPLKPLRPPPASFASLNASVFCCVSLVCGPWCNSGSGLLWGPLCKMATSF
jgi:hypothetical protein